MWTARRRLKSPRPLSGTPAHRTMVTQVNIMVMNGRLTSFSFIVNRPPHSWDKATSDSGLESPRSRSWVWPKGNVIKSALYHINSLSFHFTSIRPTLPEIKLFRNLTLKHPGSRSWVRSKVKVTYCTQHPTNVLPFHFTSIGPTITELWPKECLTLKNISEILKKICQYNRFRQHFYKILSGDNHGKDNKAATLCSDPMSGSYIIA